MFITIYASDFFPNFAETIREIQYSEPPNEFKASFDEMRQNFTYATDVELGRYSKICLKYDEQWRSIKSQFSFVQENYLNKGGILARTLWDEWAPVEWNISSTSPAQIILNNTPYLLPKRLKIKSSADLSGFVCTFTMYRTTLGFTSKHVFAFFYRAIKASHPDIQFSTEIGTDGILGQATYVSNITSLLLRTLSERANLLPKKNFAPEIHFCPDIVRKVVFRDEFAINEILQQARLGNGPHLVPIFDIVVDPLYMMFSMPRYVKDLCNHIICTKEQPFPEPTIVKWLKQIAEATQYLHQNGIAHRDIKTDNIFLDDHHNAHLGDFGCVTSQDECVEAMHKATGTAATLAPEVLERDLTKKTYDKRCDIFSIGCVLYSLMLKKLPFGSSEQTRDEFLKKHCNFEARERIVSSYSSWLNILCKEMMRCNPDRRPSIKQILETIAKEKSSE